MRVFAFTLEDYEDIVEKCPECNWDTSIGYVIAKSKIEAENMLKNERFLCGSCLAEEIAMGDYVVAEKFNPDDYPDLIFTQWLDKEDVEWYLGEKITDEEFQELKDRLESEEIADDCTEVITDRIREIYEEMKD